MLSASRTVELFQEQLGPRSFAQGEVIFQEGERGAEMYGILEGEVELVINHS
jgi:CRP-like cAMP-binding protein